MHWNARPLLYRGLVIPTLAAALPFFFVMTFLREISCQKIRIKGYGKCYRGDGVLLK
jgi:hypothetical protein